MIPVNSRRQVERRWPVGMCNDDSRANGWLSAMDKNGQGGLLALRT